MDESMLFRILLLLLYGFFGSIRIYYRTRSSAPKKADFDQKKGIDKIGGWLGVVMSVGIIGMLLSAITYVLSPPWFLWSQLCIPTIVRYIGVIIGFSSVPLLFWTHRTLGKYYAPILEVKEKHALINTGPYIHVRHPMYVVFILFTLSMALITANLFVILFSLITIFPFPFIARQEEQMLLQEFGTEYQDYMKQTGRFFPKLKPK